MTQTVPAPQSPAIDSPQVVEATSPPAPATEGPTGTPAQPWPGMGQTWTYTDEPIFKLSVEAYHELARLGFLTSDDPVELIEGVLVHRMTKNPPHEFAKVKLVTRLSRLLPPGWFVRTESPVALSDSEPEPDISVIRGDVDDFEDRHPNAAQIGLVVEIADTTLRRDQGDKRLAYVRGGVRVYWIVNLQDRRIEVHTDPNPAADPPCYAAPKDYSDSESVPVWLDGKMIGEVAVRDVLPKVK